MEKREKYYRTAIVYRFLTSWYAYFICLFISWYALPELMSKLLDYLCDKVYYSIEWITYKHIEYITWGAYILLIAAVLFAGWRLNEIWSRKAVEYFKKSAVRGDKRAQRQVGKCYMEEYSVSKNYLIAERWLLKAAQKDDAKAQRLLGQLYHNGGYGIETDVKEGYIWLEKAAENGDRKARVILSKRIDRT